MAAAESLGVVVPEIEIFSPDALAAAAAELLTDLIADAVRTRGRCRFALAGGNTPRPVYERLAAAPLAGRIPWTSIDWYWSDERAVALDDDASNYALARRSLLDKVETQADCVHRIRGELAPEVAARAYSEVVGERPIDVLLLGMGGDGHTASLFPDTPALTRLDEHVLATTSPVAPHDRISFGLRAINEARVVVMLVTGASKAARLAEVRAQQIAGVPVLPAALVQPRHGRLIWVLDRAAAKNLEVSP